MIRVELNAAGWRRARVIPISIGVRRRESRASLWGRSEREEDGECGWKQEVPVLGEASSGSAQLDLNGR